MELYVTRLSKCINLSRRPQGERQGHPEGSRAAARWLGKYSTSTGTTVLDLPVHVNRS